jgi:hypothetical protein
LNDKILQRHFREMGAELKVELVPDDEWRYRTVDYVLDVEQSSKGEYFSLQVLEEKLATLEFMVVDIQPVDRHLLLMVREWGTPHKSQKLKFLCGHDERHWFIAAVPDVWGVATVGHAMEALKPLQARNEQVGKRVKSKDRNRRRNAGYVRQGEWFFVPRPEFEPRDEGLILRNEPIQRPLGTPHMVEMLYRVGGEAVYVSRQYPQGLTEPKYHVLIQRDPDAQKLNWRVMRRNPRVYARGKVRHPDHKTIVLPFWHRVVMSVERAERGNANIAFLD